MKIETETRAAISDELKAHWRKAIELWLGSRRSASTRRSYAAALQDIQASMARMPWEISRSDVIAWAGQLRARGLSECTIAQRLAGISSFYRFCIDEYILQGAGNTPSSAPGAEIGLAVFNPAGSRSIRPHITPYGKSIWLSPEEARALLAAIRGQVGTSTGMDRIRALRDYALFLGYLMTGRRNSEWRRVKRSDFSHKNNQVMLRWSGKGKTDQLLALPEVVWTAIHAYLNAAAEMGCAPRNYLFVAQRIETDGPLCSKEVGRLLKKYCRLAGLDAKAVHVHTLRHSAAMLRKEAGDPIEDICGFLSHSSLAVTQIYVHSLEGRQDTSWGRVADLLGL